jgi:hypothetical protein
MLHSVKELLRYKWKAKGRHGTHSPFVYDFVEHVLLDKELLNKEYLVKCPWLPLKYENLICRIAAYYNYRDVLFLPTSTAPAKNVDVLLLPEKEPGKWMSLMDGDLHQLKSSGIVIVSSIHKTVAHSKAWKNMIKHPKVHMSIDVFGIGILLFREEFKERQHFVLKY